MHHVVATIECTDDLSTNITGNNIKFKVDTGAQCNVISYNTCHSIPGRPPLKKTITRLKSYDRNFIPVLGTCNLTVNKDNIPHACRFFVPSLMQSHFLI